MESSSISTITKQLSQQAKVPAQLIDDFLAFLNAKSSLYILKGGTALRACYNSSRASEDIDLDARSSNSTGDVTDIKRIVKEFCKQNNYSCTLAKDTPTVVRFKIHYQDEDATEKNPMKVEISYRNKFIHQDRTNSVNGILVYTIDELAKLKTVAYLSRSRLRDLWDLTYMVVDQYDKLQKSTLDDIGRALLEKDLDYVEFLIKNSEDDVAIDKDELVNRVLLMYEKLGLISSSPGTDSGEKEKDEETEEALQDEQNTKRRRKPIK